MATATATETTPNVPIATIDNTPPSVGEGAHIPPHRPFAYVFSPTENGIIEILRRKIHNEPEMYDMVNKADVYKEPPNNLIKRLRKFHVDGNPHYLAFTKTKVMKRDYSFLAGFPTKLCRKRNVGKKNALKGYYRSHGVREFITDDAGNPVGSKLHFSYNDGHLRKKDTGMRRAVWNMIEYQVYSEKPKADYLKYTICELYKELGSSHHKALKEKEAQLLFQKYLRDEILSLEHRGGEWDHQGTKDRMIEDLKRSEALCATPFEYEDELVDRFRGVRN